MSERAVQEVYVVVSYGRVSPRWYDGRTFASHEEAEDYIRHDAPACRDTTETYRIEKRFRVREEEDS